MKTLIVGLVVGWAWVASAQRMVVANCDTNGVWLRAGSSGEYSGGIPALYVAPGGVVNVRERVLVGGQVDLQEAGGAGLAVGIIPMGCSSNIVVYVGRVGLTNWTAYSVGEDYHSMADSFGNGLFVGGVAGFAIGVPIMFLRGAKGLFRSGVSD